MFLLLFYDLKKESSFPYSILWCIRIFKPKYYIVLGFWEKCMYLYISEKQIKNSANLLRVLDIWNKSNFKLPNINQSES